MEASEISQISGVFLFDISKQIMYKYIILLLCLFGCDEIIYTPPTVSYITSITQNGDTVKVIQVKDKYKTTYYVSPCYKNE